MSGRVSGDHHRSMAPSAENEFEKVINVPGSRAPILNVHTLWNSLMRWIVKSSTQFAQFLHSYRSNSPTKQVGTAHHVWPMNAPYPRWLLPKSQQAAEPKMGYAKMCRQKAVNLLILVLSWMQLRKPSRCPCELALGGPLSSLQRNFAWRLEQQFFELQQVGNVGPSDMGRTAARVESLVDHLGLLHAKAQMLLPEGSTEWLAFREGKGSSELKPGARRSDGGEVIGRLKEGVPMLAKDVDATRLSFPAEAPEFDPIDLLDEPHRSMYTNPISQARSPDPHIDRPPRVAVKASRKQAFALMEFLDKHHRLRLASPSDVRESHLCGAFSLVKDESKDRLILDARPPNELETTLKSWCKTLGSITALAQIELAPGNMMIFNGTDLRDYYYCFRVSRARSFRNAFAFPLAPGQVQHFNSFHPSLYQQKKVYPCLSTLAMGDTQAVELGQKVHIKMGILAGAFSPHELLAVHGKGPRGSLVAGIVIDDLVLGEQLPVDNIPEYPESCKRLDRLLEEYQQGNLTSHPKKTFRKAEKATFWGFAVDGRRGSIRANPARLLPLMELSAQTAKLGVATVSLLEVLCGCWIAVLQIKRRLLCLVDVLYECQRGRDRADIVRLSAEAIQELWTLIIMAPVATCNMCCQSISELFFTDASNDFTASVWAKVPKVFTKELQRHCLSRGVWNKLLTPWQSWLRFHGQLYEEDELPEGVPLVSHPLWVLLSRVLQCRFGHCKSVSSKRHINVLELQAVLELEKRLAVKQQDIRYCLGSDSQVTLAALVKGRSSSKQLNEMLQSSLGYFLGAGLQGNYGYVPSLCNSGDDPTRGRQIREPSEEMPAFLKAAFQGDFAGLDEWLGRLGFDPMMLADLPFSSPFSLDPEFIRKEHLDQLRSVQKAERLAKFDEAWTKPVASDVSPMVATKEKTIEREHQEPEGQTKIENKSPKRASSHKEKKGPNCHSVALKEQVAPPENSKSSLVTCARGGKNKVSETIAGEGLRRLHCEESSRSPLLLVEAKELLSKFPGTQFIQPGGRRGDKDFTPCRKGFLDLYSGKCGVAKQLATRHNVWVLTFDVEHGPGQNLLDQELQQRLLEMIEKGCFLGVGAAPECGSFSRAVRPPVRSREHPEGLTHITSNMAEKVGRGNKHAAFTLLVLTLCYTLDLAYWLENPRR